MLGGQMRDSSSDRSIISSPIDTSDASSSSPSSHAGTAVRWRTTAGSSSDSTGSPIEQGSYNEGSPRSAVSLPRRPVCSTLKGSNPVSPVHFSKQILDCEEQEVERHSRCDMGAGDLPIFSKRSASPGLIHSPQSVSPPRQASPSFLVMEQAMRHAVQRQQHGTLQLWRAVHIDAVQVGTSGALGDAWWCTRQLALALQWWQAVISECFVDDVDVAWPLKPTVEIKPTGEMTAMLDRMHKDLERRYGVSVSPNSWSATFQHRSLGLVDR